MKYSEMVWWASKEVLDAEMMRVLAIKDNCESFKKAKD